MPVRSTTLALCLAVTLLGCAADGVEATTESTEATLTASWPSLEVPAVATARTFMWRTPTREDLAERVSAVHEVMRGARLSRAEVMASIEAIDRTVSFQSGPQVMVRVDGQWDTVALYDLDLLADEWSGDEDVGEDTARIHMETALEALNDRGVLSGWAYEPARAKTSTRIAARGTRDGSSREDRVVEYRFTIMPELDGLPVTTAGVRIGIHRTGRVSSIRVGGVRAPGSASAAAAAPARLVRTSLAELRERAIAATLEEGARIHLEVEMVGYHPSRAAESALTDPKYVLGYTPVFDAASGAVAGRGVLLAISIMDPSAPVELLSPSATPGGTGDAR